MTVVELVQAVMNQAGLTKSPPVLFRCVWAPPGMPKPMTWEVNSPNPTNPDQTIVAIFKGPAERRVYLMPTVDKPGDNPTRVTLSMIGASTDSEAMDMAIFEAQLVQEFRLLGGLPAEAPETTECTHCGEDNPAEQSFCGECGKALPVEGEDDDDVECPACGELNPDGFKHCSDCGAKLPEAEKTADKPAQSAATAAS